MTLIPNYFATVASDQALQVSADGTDLVSEVGEVTQQEVTPERRDAGRLGR